MAALALVFDSATYAQTVSPPRDDNQIWTEYQLAVPFDHKTDLVAIGVLRFGRDVSRPFMSGSEQEFRGGWGSI